MRLERSLYSMSGTPLYLKPNVYMEPLINQWYAWSFLVAPHTYAMFCANWHRRIMESYLQAPQMHQRAVKNPKMLGGPFIDLPDGQTDQVRALLEKTLAEEEALLGLAEAIKSMDGLLMTEAQGHSLVNLYDRMPEPLRGFIELGYDLNNHPSFRLIERLLYQSTFYREARQSIALSSLDKDDRAFLLSTPRFPDENHLHFQMPFSSEFIDRLFAMRETPAPLENLAEMIPKDPETRATFEQFFCQEAPPARGRDRAKLGERVRIKYFGHAVLLLETADVSIMTDPLISYEIPGLTPERYSFSDLPEYIDYVLITHGHQDHIMFETLLQLRHKIGTIVVPRCNGGPLQDPSLKLILEQAGFKRVVEIDELEHISLPNGSITSLPFLGEHGDLHIRGKSAYHLRLNGKSAVCVADSNNLVPELYERLFAQFGELDALFIGMECQGAPMSWLYGPLMTRPLERRMDQSRRLDGSDAAKGLKLVRSLSPKQVYVYAMGQEPWLTFIASIKYTETSKPIVESNQLVQACKDQGLTAERLYGKKDIFL